MKRNTREFLVYSIADERQWGDATFYYCPYIPLQFIRETNPKKVEFNTRYGKMKPE